MNNANNCSLQKSSSGKRAIQLKRRSHDKANIYITLRQWRILHAVHDCGSFIEAAAQVHLSQPTISYTISQIQQQLGIEIYKLEGRKAILTDAGKQMLERSRHLLKEAAELEKFAKSLALNRQNNIWLMVEQVFPREMLSHGINAFSELMPQAKLVMIDSLGARQASMAFNEHPSSLAIYSHVPENFIAEPFMNIDYVPVACAGHSIFSGEDVTMEELSRAEQIVVGDGIPTVPHVADIDSRSLKRRFVASLSSALAHLRLGVGYTWLPRYLAERWMDRSDLHILRPEGRDTVSVVPYYLVRKTGPDSDGMPALLARTLRSSLPSAPS